MKELKDIRVELDEIDQEMVALFEKRMTLSRQVAAYKMAHGMQVLDRSREEAVLDTRASWVKDPHWQDSVRELYEAIMAVSRKEQERMMREATDHA